MLSRLNRTGTAYPTGGERRLNQVGHQSPTLGQTAATKRDLGSASLLKFVNNTPKAYLFTFQPDALLNLAYYTSIVMTLRSLRNTNARPSK